MRYLFRISPFLALFFLLSCKSEKEIKPAYLYIAPFTFTTNPNTQGLNTFEITSAKVFVNGKEIGNFQIPNTIPVIHEGNAIIEIFPNVKENATVNNQKYYIPYLYHTANKTLRALKTDSIFPTSVYRNSTNFAWIEDFDDQTLSISPSGLSNSNDSIQIIQMNTPGVDAPFSGSSHCGLIEMKSDTTALFEISTLSNFALPNKGSDVYLELDIKSNIFVQIGIYSDDGFSVIQSPVLVVNQTGGLWKKIYVNLKSETGNLPNNTRTKIFIGIFKNSDFQGTPQIYLDNIKLIYLN
ncbi:MAG: hypothetical protein Q8K70_07710 [Bacteroidota bacterium]|nr:hypothetical protein [Bacteroidota bacterium]